MSDVTILSPPYRRASIAVYTAVALAAFEGTAVAAVLPQVAGDLGRLDLLPWVVTAYLFAGGVATVVAGPLIDRLGTRRTFRWAVLIFTAAGTAAGLVQSMDTMIAVRLVHGVGAGVLGAASITAVGLVYPPRLIGRAFAANSTVWGVMGVAAPGIAAFMISVLSWRWVFLVNLPLGLIALIAGWSILPHATSTAAATTSRRPDVVGTLLVATFTLSLLLAVESLSTRSVALVGLAALLAGSYSFYAKRSIHPVLRPEHIFRQPYSTLGGAIALMLIAGFSVNIYITLYVSVARGATPTLTAWSVFFFVIGWTLGANLSSRLLDRHDGTSVMFLGSAITLLGLMLVMVGSFFIWPLWMILAGLLMAGFGIGNATNAGLTLLRSVTADDTMGRAISAHQFLRSLGFTLGTAIGGAVLLLTVNRILGSIGEVEALLSGAAQSTGPEVAEAVGRGYAANAAAGVVGAATATIPIIMLRRFLRDKSAAKPAGAYPGSTGANLPDGGDR